MVTIDKSAPILVTGGNGYIASWIIKQLLDQGFTVHSTVRDPKQKARVGHLEKMTQNAPGSLQLFKADLLEPGSFDQSIKGCELVIHTASPFILKGFKDAHAALLHPATEGTRNVLEGVNRTDTVKRVVLTSSVASICGDAVDLKQVPGGVFTEEHWNTTSNIDHQPYSYSKVSAEREAWAINKQQHRWDMVVINPSLVVGPSLTQGSNSASIDILKQFGDGTLKVGVAKFYCGLVDVRDVAQGHISAGFTPQASGRHILSATEMSMLDMGKILRKHFGDRYPFPTRQLPKFLTWLLGPIVAGIPRAFVSKNVGYPLRFDNSYSKQDLAQTYRPIEQSLIEHFTQIIDDKLL
ncbi:MAG: NAD-dependent epimerase/dehydratase family protein [Pseudomonadales bacterium]